MAGGSLEKVLADIPGLAGYRAAEQFAQQRQSGEIAQAHTLQKIMEGIQNQELMKQFSGAMAGGGAGTPDQLDAIAVRLAAGGHPGAATVSAQADKRRKAIAEAADAQAQMKVIRSPAPAPVQSAPDPEGLKMVSDTGAAPAMIPGTNFTNPTAEQVPPEQRAAFDKVLNDARAKNATARGEGGLFAPLMESEIPSIAAAAKTYQQQANAAPPSQAKYWEDRFKQLQTQETSLLGRKSAAEAAVASRPGRDPLKAVIGPDGKTPVLVPESQAAGMTPFSPSMHGGTASGREAIFNKRIVLSSNQAMKDLENVVQLPMTASTGLFGGRSQGPGLFDAGKEVLAQKLTGQEAQSYNAMATGFQRSLATIEAAGLMPSGNLTHQMDAVIFKEGDTNLTKLHKLAQTRQIVESGLEVLESDDRVSQDVKDHVKKIIERVQKAVPFTHSDLIKMTQRQEVNPDTTLADVMKKPAASDVQEFATEADAAKAGLKPGTRVKIGGKTGVWR